jgi:predicted nucleic acid-binding Zn ribbon protein
MNAIHENYRNTRMENNMNRQLEEISNKENEISKKAKEKRTNLLMMIALILIVFAVFFLGTKYNEEQIKDCMESGSSETFCRFAGE